MTAYWYQIDNISVSVSVANEILTCTTVFQRVLNNYTTKSFLENIYLFGSVNVNKKIIISYSNNKYHEQIVKSINDVGCGMHELYTFLKL